MYFYFILMKLNYFLIQKVHNVYARIRTTKQSLSFQYKALKIYLNFPVYARYINMAGIAIPYVYKNGIVGILYVALFTSVVYISTSH